MTIKWTNIIALVLTLVALTAIFKMPREIGAFLRTMDDIGSGHAHDEMMGLLAFGFVLVLIVAVTKIVVNNNRKN